MRVVLAVLALVAAALASPVQNALSYDDVMAVFRTMLSKAHERQTKAAEAARRLHGQMAEVAAAVPQMLDDVHREMTSVMRDGVQNVQAGRQMAQVAENTLMAIENHLDQQKEGCPSNVYQYREDMSFPVLPKMSDYAKPQVDEQDVVPVGGSEAEEAINQILGMINMMESEGNKIEGVLADIQEGNQHVLEQYGGNARLKLADVVRAIVELGRGLEANRLNELQERLDRAREQVDQMKSGLSHARAIARLATGLQDAVGSASSQHINRLATRAENLSKVLSYVQCKA